MVNECRFWLWDSTKVTEQQLKAATEQFKRICEKFPVTFGLLDGCAANGDAVADWIKYAVDKGTFTEDCTDLMRMIRYWNSVKPESLQGYWRAKLHEFAPYSYVTDQNWAEWMWDKGIMSVNPAEVDYESGFGTLYCESVWKALDCFSNNYAPKEETMDEQVKKQLQELCKKYPVEFTAFYEESARDYVYLKWLQAKVRDNELTEPEVNQVIDWLEKALDNVANKYNDAMQDAFRHTEGLLPKLQNTTLKLWIHNAGGASEITEQIKDDSSSVDVIWSKPLATGVAILAMTRFVHDLNY